MSAPACSSFSVTADAWCQQHADKTKQNREQRPRVESDAHGDTDRQRVSDLWNEEKGRLREAHVASVAAETFAAEQRFGPQLLSSKRPMRTRTAQARRTCAELAAELSPCTRSTRPQRIGVNIASRRVPPAGGPRGCRRT
eukprot:2468598-Rhodomonas_salina.1